MKKRAYAIIAALCLTTAAVGATAVTMTGFSKTASAEVVNEKLGDPIVVYGGSLSAAEKDTVKQQLEVAGTVKEITVTGADIAKYIQNGNASARLFSSAEITPEESGHGIVVDIKTPQNITQVTADMYSNAMLTAGITDAKVEVAAPKQVTGHSALAGIYKAYEVSTGEKLDTERTDVANQELGVATDLAEKSGIDQDKVSQLLTEIKQQIAEQKPATKEEVAQIVDDKLSELKVSLSDEDRQLLINLMDKISNLDINFGQWSDQLTDLGGKLTDSINGLKDSVNENTGFWDKVVQWFKNLFGMGDDTESESK
jgi:uncharacterized protein YpuA (DUF1002 family)